METWIVTGPAASGKSDLCRDLLAGCGARGFDSDAQVHELFGSPEILKAIASKFGPEMIGTDEKVNRDRLREVVFSRPDAREWLEELFHPLVLALFEASRINSNDAHAKVLVAEVPLLNESKVRFSADLTIAVAVSPVVQTQRLLSCRGLSQTAIEQLRAAQWPVLKTAELADKVVWNDGSPQLLILQAHILAQQLKQHE
ncbi:MAG: dephospho-CoA kinase [Roseimicrobium sp.]